MTQRIRVSELRVGMFVHLDLGWMSHPFPLSSFKIVSQDQIDEIVGLGLHNVLWVPEKSDPLVAQGLMAVPGLEQGELAQELADDDSTGTTAFAAFQPVVETPAHATETPAQASARQRREQLFRQRQAARVCERQYAEAGKAWRGACDKVADDPEGARKDTEALTQALLDKMLGESEMCIRVLNSASGDRSTAHAINVAVVSMLMGRALGLAAEDMADLGTGALLHDVGKLELPERLRHHDEQFTADESQAYRDHVAHGVAHARRMGLSLGAQYVIAQHHELADGSGFPQAVTLDRMTMPARIVALVNRFDNLCNPAVLARALTPHEALSLLFSQARTKFDTTLLNGFIRMMGVYPAGSVVQLTDDRYAMVVSVNSARPLKPRVLVFDPSVPADEAVHLDLESVPDLGIRRSLRPTLLPAAAKAYLAPRQRVAYFFESTNFGALQTNFAALPAEPEAVS